MVTCQTADPVSHIAVRCSTTDQPRLLTGINVSAAHIVQIGNQEFAIPPTLGQPPASPAASSPPTPVSSPPPVVSPMLLLCAAITSGMALQCFIDVRHLRSSACKCMPDATLHLHQSNLLSLFLRTSSTQGWTAACMVVSMHVAGLHNGRIDLSTVL